MRLILTVSLALSFAVAFARADVADPGSDPVPVLEGLVQLLDDAGVDVLYDHASAAGQVAPSFGDRPRLAPLVGFRAWPNIELDVLRYGAWLDGFKEGLRGAIAAVPADGGDTRPGRQEFRSIWKDADEGDRVVITFASADLDVAQKVAGMLETKGYAVYLALADPETEKLDAEKLGRLFADADHHLTIDSAAARLNPIIQFEAELLAELRRQDAWLASDDGGLPPVKRGAMDVVESLGMLPMKVVPGGIVLGTTAVLDASLFASAWIEADSETDADTESESGVTAAFAYDGSDYGIDVNGRAYVLEQVSAETRDAILAFVGIDDSHSVVDIAGSDVELVAPFKRTRIGNRMAQADRMPFDHLSVRGAQKSVIVDESVRLRLDYDGTLAADVTLAVRFYRRTDGGKADRLATLRFTVEDATGSARLLDLGWERRPGSRIGFDGSGIDKLVDDLEQLALDAALVAVARLPKKS